MFPKDKRVLDFQIYPSDWCSKILFFQANVSLDIGLTVITLIDEFDNIIVKSRKLNCKPMKGNKVLLVDMFLITIKDRNYLFKKRVHINQGGALLKHEQGLYDQDNKMLISGDCYNREMLIHEFSLDIYHLLPSFVTLFLDCGTEYI
ncbi:MAG: hypothetical protein LBT09_06765 [Planctomycetaceae bacterium]|jgi:hypothetical protein|nr:hypothetical protein [Planctomycetaceae bacterium]